MARLTVVGNSKGVLIPKAWVQQLGLDNCELSLSLKEGGILIKPKKNNPREGWAEEIEHALKAHPYDFDSEWLESDLNNHD